MSNIPYSVMSGVNIFDEKNHKPLAGETSIPKYISDVKASVNWLFFGENPNSSLPFGINIRIIDTLLGDINPIDFTINYYVNEEGLTKGMIDAEKIVKNKKGSSLGTLKVLLYGIINNLTIGEILPLFSEHYIDVLDDKKGDSHANIRALMTFPSDTLVKAICPELKHGDEIKLKEIAPNYKPQN